MSAFGTFPSVRCDVRHVAFGGMADMTALTAWVVPVENDPEPTFQITKQVLVRYPACMVSKPASYRQRNFL
jgi:hypothetical protein